MRFGSKSQKNFKPRFAKRLFFIAIFLADPWLSISKMICRA
jgi:hypothetical protein